MEIFWKSFGNLLGIFWELYSSKNDIIESAPRWFKFNHKGAPLLPPPLSNTRDSENASEGRRSPWPYLFIFLASGVDCFAIYLSTSMPLQTQYPGIPNLKKTSMALSILFGLIDMVSFNFYQGPEMRRFLPCSKTDVRADARTSSIAELSNNGYEILPTEPNNGQDGQESKKNYLNNAMCRSVMTGLYIPLALTKSFLDYAYFIYSLCSWSAQWQGIFKPNHSHAETSHLPSLITALNPLKIWQLGVLALSYLLFILPLYITTDLQEVCNVLQDKPNRLSSFRHRSSFNLILQFLILKVSPYVLPILRNLPQLVFFSPYFIKNLTLSYWGILPVTAYAALWLLNLHTTYKMIKNFDLQNAQFFLKKPILNSKNPENNIQPFKRFLWSTSQNMERSLAFAQYFIAEFFKHQCLKTHAIVSTVCVLVAQIPAYMLSLPGQKSRHCDEEHCRQTSRNPSSGGISLHKPEQSKKEEQNVQLIV